MFVCMYVCNNWQIYKQKIEVNYFLDLVIEPDPDASSLLTVPQGSYKRLVQETLYEDTVHNHLVWCSTNEIDLPSKLNISL